MPALAYTSRHPRRYTWCSELHAPAPACIVHLARWWLAHACVLLRLGQAVAAAPSEASRLLTVAATKRVRSNPHVNRRLPVRAELTRPRTGHLAKPAAHQAPRVNAECARRDPLPFLTNRRPHPRSHPNPLSAHLVVPAGTYRCAPLPLLPYLCCAPCHCSRIDAAGLPAGLAPRRSRFVMNPPHTWRRCMTSA